MVLKQLFGQRIKHLAVMDCGHHHRVLRHGAPGPAEGGGQGELEVSEALALPDPVTEPVHGDTPQHNEINPDRVLQADRDTRAVNPFP